MIKKSTLLCLFSFASAVTAGVQCAHAETPVVAPTPEKIGIEINATAAASGGVRLKALGWEYPEMRSYESTLALKFSSPLPGSGQFGFGLNAQRTTFRMDQGAWRLPVPDRLQNINAELTYQNQFNEHWTGMFSVSPGWRTAGSTSLNSKGFGVMGMAMGIYSASPTLKFAVGAMGDTLAVGSSRFVPVFGLDWQFAPQWRLALGVPRTGLFYAVSEALELGVVAEGTWSTYYVDKKARFATVGGRVLTDTKLEYAEARAGFQVNWHFTPQSSLSVSAGAIGYRGFKYPERNLKLKTTGVDGGYASVGFTFQF